MSRTMPYRNAAFAAMTAGLGGLALLGTIPKDQYEAAPLWLQLLAGLVPMHLSAFAAAVALLAGNAIRKGQARRALRRLGFGPSRRLRFCSPSFLLASACAASACCALLVLAWTALLRRLNFPVTGSPLLEAVQENGAPPAWLSLFVIAVLIAPPVEEFLFREVLFRTLRKRAFWRPALLSAGIFAVVHGVLAQAPALFGLALFLQWLRERSGSLRAPTAVHAAFNLIAVSLTALDTWT